MVTWGLIFVRTMCSPRFHQNQGLGEIFQAPYIFWESLLLKAEMSNPLTFCSKTLFDILASAPVRWKVLS